MNCTLICKQSADPGDARGIKEMLYSFNALMRTFVGSGGWYNVSRKVELVIYIKILCQVFDGLLGLMVINRVTLGFLAGK